MKKFAIGPSQATVKKCLKKTIGLYFDVFLIAKIFFIHGLKHLKFQIIKMFMIYVE